LERGGTSIEACEAAVKVMEASKILNAGAGAYRQADGMIRRDASIMTGDGRAGSVAQVPYLAHPIGLAGYLLRQDAHVMLCGLEAFLLGLRLGHPCVFAPTDGKNKFWREHLSEACLALDYEAMAKEWKASHPRLGTVGCVCLDQQGNLAAGTSTGGTGQVYPGRVGDTPIIGGGTYCTSEVGVSMTGVGERIMVLLSAKRLCDYVSGGKLIGEAARLVLDEIGQRSSGSAGLIALDAGGKAEAMTNTPFMAWAKRG
jgi:L-asparaginase / beta-aspartyl-peptidase